MAEAAQNAATRGTTAHRAVDQGMGIDIPQRTKLEILGAILLGLFLGALDQTIVGTALPRIVTDLRGNDLYIWVVTIYLLTSTITGPFYGKLSDLYGRKPLMMIGITLFLAGSALSGLSQEMWQLILFRGIQGLGAGALFPIALAVIGDLFTPAERGKYQGLFGAVFGVSSIVGPALGGFLTDTISWHWIFYVNLPIGLISLAVIWRLLPTVKRPDVSHSLDYLGAAVFSVAIGTLLVGLTNKQTGEWTDPAVGGLIGLGILLSLVFVAVEARAKEPIVPLAIFRIRSYSASIAASFFAAFGFFAAVIFLPRYFQFVRGVSATASGYQSMALLIGLILSAVISGLIVARTGRYKRLILGSLVIMGVGLGLLTQLRADTPLPILWFWMFVTGVGIGPSFSVFTIVVQNAVPFRVLGVATSNLTFFRQIGGVVGLAIASTILGTSLREQLPTQLVAKGIPQQYANQFAHNFGSGGSNVTGVGVDLGKQLASVLPAQAQAFIPNIVDAIHAAFSLAIASTFIVGIAAGLVAIVAALFIEEIPLRTTAGAEAGAETGADAARGEGLRRPLSGLPAIE